MATETERSAAPTPSGAEAGEHEPPGDRRLVLVVDDEATFRDLYCQVLDEAGFATLEAGSAERALETMGRVLPALVVSDVRMPGIGGLDLLRQVRQRWPAMPFLLVTAYSEVREAVEALKLGAVEYLTKPIDLDALIGTVREALGIERDTADPELPPTALEGLIAESPSMRRILRDAFRVAPSDATVLLTGESGVGKDVVAQFIHRHSARAAGPLVAVNCGAIPADLLPAALFGHHKGAFTGAVGSRRGHFRDADGGTLFLDEIGELPLALQPVLLRALETRRFVPLGGDAEVAVDVRILAATNRELEHAVADGRFRADLYYRLNVIAFEVPSLASRPEDLVPLGACCGLSESRPIRQAFCRARLDHGLSSSDRLSASAASRGASAANQDVVPAPSAQMLPNHRPRGVNQAATTP